LPPLCRVVHDAAQPDIQRFLENNMLPIGVCILPEMRPNASRTVSYPDYVHEILSHAGLCYATLAWDYLIETLPEVRLLVTVGETALSEEVKTALRLWVEGGGLWISVSGVCGMPDLFGVEVEAPAYSSWGGGMSTLGEGYLQPAQAGHPILAHLPFPLHYFNGIPVQPAHCETLAHVLDKHQRATPRAALTRKQVGNGLCILIAPDIPGTVVRIQQGIAVTRDGVSADDGTAPVADSVLKSGDGHVLDWIFDRQPVEGVPGYSAFLHPIADLWRELLLRAIFQVAQEREIALPLLWLYPRNLPAIGHISHDTDGNNPHDAQLLLDAMREAGVHSSWCVILPGYAPELISAIRDAGHELAMHFDSASPMAAWSEGAFDAQWRLLREQFGGQEILTNKNHFLRWEGDCEFFAWCERKGIRIEQSKGASKTGEAGFNFGTCHPYPPVAFDGTRYHLLELPTPTQDLTVFAPYALLEPLLQAALKAHGVLHLLFHPAHIQKPGVKEAIVNAARQAREADMEWWTGAQIWHWEAARRYALQQTRYQMEANRARLELIEGLPEATYLWLAPSTLTLYRDAQVVETTTVTRWGFAFQAVVCGQEPGPIQLEATWEPTR
jgi:peptidoglycan/xylan/chitin deacetylase (PgdA/CDA1 family)